MGRAVDQNAGRSKDRAFHVLGRDFSSGSTFSADSLTAFVQPSSVCNRMRQEMHVHTLKIPNTGSHAVAWTHENAAHAGKNGLRVYRCSCGCYTLTKEVDPKFPTRG